MAKSKLILYISLISFLSLVKSTPNIGFTTDLIHRDSPQSPSYNPSLTPFQRIINALKRSSKHSRRFNAPQSNLLYSGGDYLMKFSIGSPPAPSLGIADTGSDIIWTQCQPCVTCFNQSLPIFIPKTSHTYRKISCNTTRCHLLPDSYCSTSREKNCLYSVEYGDQSYTYGELATDTFTLSSSYGNNTVSFRNILFGCGFKNGGVFSGSESGIVGLGGGKASLVRQLGQGKFSYCLNSLSGSSKLRFGSIAKISGRRVVSTPLVRKSPETYYYLTLEGIRVGNEQFLSDSRQEGNMIIDSGTTLTFLPPGLYAKVEKAIRRSVKLKRTKDRAGVLSLCYFTRKDIVKFPEVVVRFKGGDVKLNYENVFVRTSDVAVCLAAKPAEEGPVIYGNIAQMNFLVGYDLKKRTVSFMPTDCGKL
ncbi:hypothetical protein ACS0TY_019818 [Phlomoides rotata]